MTRPSAAALGGAVAVSGRPLARRLFGNYLLQLVNLGLRLLDQLLLIPLYIFAWGTDLYRDWLVLTALIWFLNSCSFGTEEYFSNVFLRSAAAGDHVTLTRQIRIGLFISSMISVLVLTSVYVILLTGGISHLFGFARIDNRQATHVLLVMTLPLWCWYQTMVLHGVYRAFGDFSRGECIYAIYLIVQLGSVAMALTFRQPTIIVALCYGLAPILCAAMTVIDVRRRYPGTALRLAVPTRAEWRQVVPQSLMYFTNALALPLTQQGPLLIFGFLDFSAGAIVTFNVCRVFTGVTRMIGAYCFSIGTGIEMARQYVQNDHQACRALYADGGRIVACLAGLLAGVSIPFSGPFIALWTRGAMTADARLVVCFLVGIFFAAQGRQALMLLSYTNNARAIAFANSLYAVLGLLLVGILAHLSGVLGAAIALALTEIIGIGLYPPIAVSTRFGFGALRQLSAGYAAGSCVLGLSYGVATVLAPTTAPGALALVARGAAWAAVMALPTLIIALPPGQRARLVGILRRYFPARRAMPTR
jgi:O-antigen/teichoic acid export membrane protein